MSRGGARQGAGRKPAPETKKTISLYITESAYLKLNMLSNTFKTSKSKIIEELLKETYLKNG